MFFDYLSKIRVTRIMLSELFKMNQMLSGFSDMNSNVHTQEKGQGGKRNIYLLIKQSYPTTAGINKT